jgi:hypothetical protein
MTVGKVKDFNFGSAGKTVGLCHGGMAKPKAYAKGGKVMPKRETMMKRETTQTPTMERQAVMEEAVVRAPARRAVPVAAREPMIALKKGGPAMKKC